MIPPGLHLRPFQGVADYQLMAQLANETFAHEGLDLFRTAEDYVRDFATVRDFVPERDMLMVEIDGTLAAYARCWWWQQADGVVILTGVGLVPPRLRRRGIGRMLLAWIEQRQDAIARERPSGSACVRQSFMSEVERDRARLVQAAGYRPVRHFLKMVRPDLDAIPDVPLPAGVEVRPVLPQHYRAIWEAHTEAMSGHWGFVRPKPGDYEHWLESKVFQPQLWQVAWDSDRVAGQVKPFIDKVYNDGFGKHRGWTEFISVAADWRRRGLAHALIARALQAQREAGMTESALGVDSDNAHGASRVYADCGFRTVERSTCYRKDYSTTSEAFKVVTRVPGTPPPA
jgi:GNAT superfamily N-acetyltransferase